MTQSKEDYIKAIYTAGGVSERVPTATVARMLGIAPASVTEMNVKLCKEGLVEYEPYKGVKLTEKGIAAVVNVIRSHELWEVFLTSYLGLSMHEAHQEAERLEHATSPLLAERLDEFLQHPETCPLGSGIPRPGMLPEVQIERLSDLEVSTEAVLYKLFAGREELEEEKKTALKPGLSIVVLSKDEDSLTVECGGRTCKLSPAQASGILVSVE